MTQTTIDQHITNMEEAATIESESLLQSEAIYQQLLKSGFCIHKGNIFAMHEFIARDDVDEKYCESLMEGRSIDDDIDEVLFLFCRAIYEGEL